MGSKPLASVGAVRDELRQLGYLESGLDRFVLSGKGAPSLLGVSARVGIAGGILLGPLLTLAASSLDRRLLTDPWDLAILALYSSMALGAATGLAALLGGLVAAGTSRRLSGTALSHLSRNVGLGIAMLGLAYLVLWWRSHAFHASLPLQGAALVVGVGLSLLLARFGSLAAVAVLSAGGLGDSLPKASLTRRQLAPLVVLASLGIGGGLVLAGFWGGGGTQAPEFAVVPTGLRVRLLGIDGLEGRMVAGVEMPHLESLLASGARARLRPEREAVPAIVWTSIATGRGPEAHGILATDTRRLPGMRTAVPLGTGAGPFGAALASTLDLLRITRAEPPSARLRGAKTFWNVASEKGLRVGIVNWWATWPAEPVNGFIVTDRAFFRLEKGGPPDREVYPPEAFPTLQGLGTGDAGIDRARRLDHFEAEAARALAGPDPPDLEAVYLPGLDIFTVQQLGEAPPDLATLDSRLAAVRAYHQFVDGLIGRVLEHPTPGEVLVLVGDPGRYSRRSRGAEGILAMAGGPVQKADLGTVSERDLAPTLLHLLGLPVSRELDGRVLETALDPSFRTAHPVRTVASYGSRPRGALAESAFDKDVVEALRSLGYVQ
jgi:hypothetical protein